MATRHVQKVLSPRTRSTSLDVERDNFEKNQVASVTKAVNHIECPVKEKHVRRILMGTHQEKSSATFWLVVRSDKTPIQGNPIVCWKFCHVLHKILREGHRKSIADAYPYRGLILETGKMWGLLKEGYGKLIQNYCTLLVNKIDFHVRNPRFPGNLQVTDAELDKIGESDVNVFFQLACEMFDYLDEILCLQSSVFGSLEVSGANSLTSPGQCRLAPLIPCVQDSSLLYDYSVKVLFKLHAVLPAGTLDGHRDRFLSQFKILKQFYFNASNKQYFKNLITIPQLPQNPPNFLRQSELHSHVTPVVVIPQQTDSPDGSEATDTLIDLSLPQLGSEASDDTLSNWSEFPSEHTNGYQAIIEDKNAMINRLSAKIEELQMQLQQLRVESGRAINAQKSALTDLQLHSVEQDRALSALKIEKESLTKELEDLRQELARHSAGTDIQTELGKEKEKFVKMKDVYNKLREQHIELLRAKGEGDKQIIMIRAQATEGMKAKDELESQLKEARLKASQANDQSAALADLQQKLELSEARNKKLLSEMAQLHQEKLEIEKLFASAKEEIEELRAMRSEDEKSTKYVGEMLMKELTDMDKAIHDAANRIEEMMTTAKQKDTGVKLEVNGKVLDACTTLMQAIMQLIQDSKELQKEIVAQGKGSASSTEFYQRNHAWTEGLISAAKVVAMGAKLLVDAADKVVDGNAKFEELIVASQEIAAATAQLVIASRVKASRTSEKMAKLSSSSKRVTESTGNVVATAKNCAQLVDEGDSFDFTKLSPHQAKRLEMEAKIEILELDTKLVKKREMLSRLRKAHYHTDEVSNQ